MPPSREQTILGVDPPFAATPSPTLVPVGESVNDGILARAGENDPIPLLDNPQPKPQVTLAAGTLELTLLGNYTNPWKTDPVTEARLAMGLVPAAPGGESPHWSPATDTFEASAKAEPAGAGTIATCANLDDLLNAIVQRSDGSIKRINIITHGDSGGIGIRGEIKATTFTDKNNAANSFVPGTVIFTLDRTYLSATLLKGVTGSDVAKRDQARQKFGGGAGIFLYSCNAASDASLVKALAEFFKVQVTGFGATVGYFPDVAFDAAKKPLRITDRTKSGVDNGSGKADPLFPPVVGFKHLNSESVMFPNTVNP